MHRCRICGETYLGDDAPAQCPFCGAHREHMIDPREYPPEINDVQLTEQERKDLEAAVELERANTRFYLGMAEHKDNPALSSTYKRLSRIEAEHCSLFCKLLKMPKPADLNEPIETHPPFPCGSSSMGGAKGWLEDIDESLRREKKASALYAEFRHRATSDRVREVFDAVSEVELDHIDLDELAKGYARQET